ncbi:hypothetical protein H4R99_006159 [Coemansia sp. RSA 1722]|nr:hypothetical protein LPJ57_003323 [Coemansia sp. RSA 486]KAJ2229152.1 hypothetical protein IWW45_006315 [Coemansia sp. RSA 485]KAJ2593232.1 hypothetical protein H4R99_006159 [Coemansia sp. RSA 1722]
MSSTVPSRRPRHQRRRKHTNASTGRHSDCVPNMQGTGWLCMPCLPQDIIESTQYEATIVGRTAKSRQPCAFTESQAMGLALILAEQYVRAADTCPLTASQMPLVEQPEETKAETEEAKSSTETGESIMDNEGFVDVSWSTGPSNESMESLLSVSTVSPTCSPGLSTQSCGSVEEQKSSRHLGFLTLPLRSTRAVSSSGSTVVGSSLLSINGNSSSKNNRLGNQFRRPAQWIRNLFSS